MAKKKKSAAPKQAGRKRPAAQSSQVSLSVMVDEGHVGQMAQVRRDLEAAGLAVHDVLDAVGVITGSASASALGQIESVKGVATVEKSQPVQLAPPTSDVQ